jgi:hypothetical protein
VNRSISIRRKTLEQLIREFIGIFTVEKTVYNELLRLSKIKKDILIKNDVDELNNIVLKEKEANKKIGALEKKRELVVQRLAQHMGKDAGDVTLNVIVDMAEGIQKNQLIDLKNNFTILLKQLADSNDVNKDLINTHLKYTAFSLDVITQSTNTSETYNNAGGMNDEKKQRIGIIDQKA